MVDILIVVLIIAAVAYTIRHTVRSLTPQPGQSTCRRCGGHCPIIQSQAFHE